MCSSTTALRPIHRLGGCTGLSGRRSLTTAVIQAIMSEEKANQKARLKIPMERIRKYFPQSYTAAQIEDAVVKLCERDYRRRTDRER